jgi:hypothetical protein
MRLAENYSAIAGGHFGRRMYPSCQPVRLSPGATSAHPVRSRRGSARRSAGRGLDPCDPKDKPRAEVHAASPTDSRMLPLRPRASLLLVDWGTLKDSRTSEAIRMSAISWHPSGRAFSFLRCMVSSATSRRRASPYQDNDSLLRSWPIAAGLNRVSFIISLERGRPCSVGDSATLVRHRRLGFGV